MYVMEVSKADLSVLTVSRFLSHQNAVTLNAVKYAENRTAVENTFYKDANCWRLTWHFLDIKSRRMFAHNFHTSVTGDTLAPMRGWAWLSISGSSFLSRFTGRRTSCRPTTGGADNGVLADSNEELYTDVLAGVTEHEVVVSAFLFTPFFVWQNNDTIQWNITPYN